MPNSLSNNLYSITYDYVRFDAHVKEEQEEKHKTMTDVKLKFIPRDPLKPSKPLVLLGAVVLNFALAFPLAGLVDPMYDFIAAHFGNNVYSDDFVRFLQDHVGNEVVALKLFCAGLIAYCIYGLLLTLEDLAVIHFQLKHEKIQGGKSFFTVHQWLRAVGLSLFNLIFVNWAVVVPCFWFWQYMYAGRLYSEDDPWVWQTEWPKFIVCALAGETGFYWTHRALHIPILYRNFHKMHHHFTAPIAVATIYQHPVEFIINNIFAVLSGPVLSNMHPRSAYFYLVYALIQTLGGHSGYEWHGGVNHDLHHEKFDVNFGSLKLWDTICGTQYHLSDLCKREQMRKQRKEAERGISAATVIEGSSQESRKDM